MEAAREVVRVGFHLGDTSETIMFGLGISLRGDEAAWRRKAWVWTTRVGRASRGVREGWQICEGCWRLRKEDDRAFEMRHTLACSG